MAKHARKVQAALRRRQNDFADIKGGKQGEFHMPGSLNAHKTGYAKA